MKKITFTIIVLAVLLLLSGCDEMLEFFYPEYADDNQLTVYIDITTMDAVLYSYSGIKPLNVEIYETGKTPGANLPVQKIELMNQFDHFRCDFLLSDGSYDIWIWQDSNNSGGLNAGDFILNETPDITFETSIDELEYTASKWKTN